jgi:hypothetical protein
MTKIGSLEVFSTGGAGSVQSITGNSGGAVSGSTTSNIDLIGDNAQGINVVGNPGTNTLTISGIDATTSTPGVVPLATNAEVIAGVDSTKAVTSSALAAKLGPQTAHSLIVSEGAGSAFTALGPATNGQIPIGSTGADPVLATLTAGANVTITNSPGGITIASAGTGMSLTVLGNSGEASPNGLSQINIIGDGTSIDTTGDGSHTLTISGIQATTSTAGVSALATNAQAIAGVNTTNAVTPSSLAAKLGTQTAHSILIAEGTGSAFTALGPATNGQIPIGSTGADPILANLTAGPNISITNGAGSITIGSSSSTVASMYKSVNSNYTVAVTDYYISVDSSGGPITVTFPNAPATDQIFIIKDRLGTSATNNITITTAGGAIDIDGSTSYIIKTNYEALNLLFNGTSYEVF